MKFTPATMAELMELEKVAEQTAERIMRSPKGWPAAQHFPVLFFKSRRFGVAHDVNRELLDDQIFIWVKGSGPWLGQDGALYWQIGSTGTAFFRRSLRQLEMVYDSARVAKVIEHLKALEY